MREVIRDLQVRSGIMERDARDLRGEIETLKDSNKRLRRELRATQASLDQMARTVDQAHNMMSQIIQRVGKRK